MRKYLAVFSGGPVRTAIFAFAIWFVASSCSSNQAIKKRLYKKGDTRVSSSQPSTTAGQYYVVQKGDTLYSVSKKFGVSTEALRQANNIPDVRDIETGTKIVIPPADENKIAQPEKPAAALVIKEEPKPQPKPKPQQQPQQQQQVQPKSNEDEKEYTAPANGGKFIWPLTKFSIISRFGIHGGQKQDGMDMRAPQGAPVMAVADGKVIFSGAGPTAFGNVVVIKHDKNTISVYGHNDQHLVKEGDKVKQGQKIATVGKSGRAEGYQLHLELRISRKTVDPLKFLPNLQ